ncbi:glycerophosphodiester phosphodiesterase family protein [Paracoccus sp. Z330]|uniref:Glycerophosphodiester phosphodiesterase family protein n=1 Tax=Paracoccus onchidii TaxID=3017813 RepID=A0ABT4ZBT3_9RHOB|nr:glycerophosphodiester phosphodiesterase family protein [Paracoccus onchidii]MDB6176819.1 glycerophosphodiester phosphodiesterase family protein [Paracoccus onchidii]
MPALPQAFLNVPITHRGLHDDKVPENSLAAAKAAIDAGYGIEMDIQPAADGTAMVFHDYDLTRLAGDRRFVADISADELAGISLKGSNETVPTLRQMLDLVAGRVPLLIEIKDQDGRLGGNIGDLHKQVAGQLADYAGPVAVMSFNPHVVGAFHRISPDIPVGLTTCGYAPEHWAMLDQDAREHLADISDFDDVGASFISHDHNDLGNPRVDALKAQAVPVLCWTIRSPAQEAAARKVADNITFEGYQAAI